MDLPEVRSLSYIDGEEAFGEEVDDKLLKYTGSNLTALTSASELEGPPPLSSRAQTPTLVAAPQQNPQEKAAEQEEQKLRAMADGGKIVAPAAALDPEQAAQVNVLTKLPPIDRGYAWIIALGKRSNARYRAKRYNNLNEGIDLYICKCKRKYK